MNLQFSGTSEAFICLRTNNLEYERKYYEYCTMESTDVIQLADFWRAVDFAQ